jgi:hypothetical protein
MVVLERPKYHMWRFEIAKLRQLPWVKLPLLYVNNYGMEMLVSFEIKSLNGN